MRVTQQTRSVSLPDRQNIYFGASEEETKEARDLRRLIYRAREAITHLASMEVTASEWLGRAQSWHLHDFNSGDEVESAALWLLALDEAWRKRDEQ